MRRLALHPRFFMRWVLNIISPASAEPIGVGIGIGVAVEIGKLKSVVISIPIPISTPIMLFKPL